MAKPTPPTNATTTTLQVGTYNPLTENANSDGFTLLADLNDTVATWIIPGTLKMPPPDKTWVESGNIRSPGVSVVRWQYKSRTIDLSISIRGSSYAAIRATVSTLTAALENPPYTLRFAWPGASQYSYFDVIKCTHNVPEDPILWLNKALPHYEIHFECMPGIRGDRVTLSNLAVNPGFEAPAGGGTAQTMPVAFTDSFANTNAYAVQAGSAPTTDKSFYTDVLLAQVAASGGTLARYYRLDESSGTTATDVSASAANGTYSNCTLGAAGGLTGDTDTAVTFNGSSSKVTGASTNLPTGTTAFTMAALLKPASLASLICGGSFGGTGTGAGAQIYIDTSGKFHGGIIGAAVDAIGAAHTAGSYYRVYFTWDGSNQRIYVNGSLEGGPTAPGVTVNIGTNAGLSVGAQLGSSLWWNGQIDEFWIVSGAALSATAISAIDAAATTAPATVSQSMQIPSGGRVRFGSPAWGALQQWQMRFRYYAGASVSWYLHYTDANNYTSAFLNGTSLTLYHVVAGTAHTLATATVSPGNECPYWLRVTQFPTVSGNPPMVQATLYLDAGGAVGGQIATLGPVATYDAVTALVGSPQIGVSGAALGIGGNYAGVHTVALFGPGGWTPNNNLNNASPSALAWDGTRSELGMSGSATSGTQTYGGGPVTSFGSGRIDLAPTGNASAAWYTYAGGTPAGTSAMPVKSAGDVVYAVAWAKSSGLNATNGQIIAQLYEWDSSGNFLRLSTLQTLTGDQTSWTKLSGSVTTGTNCAYVSLRLVAQDTAGTSGNATVWFDNVQCWDSTNTANGETSMGYHELRFPNSPAQLMVSGLLGDMPAPCLLMLGTYLASNYSSPYPSLLFYVGRLSRSAGAGALISRATPVGGNTFDTMILDATSWGGCAMRAGANWTSWQAPGDFSYPWNKLVMQNWRGTYHLLVRYKPAGSVANLTGLVAYSESSPDLIAGVTQTTTAVKLFTASGSYQTGDCGQVAIPATSSGGLQDTSLLNASVGPQFAPVTGDLFNVCALVPVDGSLLTGTWNLGSSIAQNEYGWLYVDGLPQGADTPAWRWNQGANALTAPTYSSAIPNPATALGGSATASIGQASVNPGCDPVMLLDPTTTVGGNAVNQMVVWWNDANATQNTLAIYGQIDYTPLYLWPR